MEKNEKMTNSLYKKFQMQEKKIKFPKIYLCEKLKNSTILRFFLIERPKSPVIIHQNRRRKRVSCAKAFKTRK